MPSFEKLEHDIIRSRTTNKHKRKTAQSIRDYEEVKKRVFETGIKMDLISEYLDKVFGVHVTALSLVDNACKLSQQLGLRVDRLAKRNRSAMLCWYAEHWDLIRPLLPQRSDSQIVGLVKNELPTKHPIQTHNHIDISDINQLLNFH